MLDIIKEIHLVLTKTNKTNLTKLIKGLIKGEEGEEKEENIMETQDAIQALKKIVLHYNTEDDFYLVKKFLKILYIQSRTLPKNSNRNNRTITKTNRRRRRTNCRPKGNQNQNQELYAPINGGYRTRRNRHSKTKKINSPNSLKYTKKTFLVN